MGIIKRQGFKSAIVNYIGVIIAVIGTFFVYSKEKQLYGLYQFLYSIATILSPVIIFGASSIAIRFHPKNQSDPDRYRGLLTFILGVFVFGSLTALLLFLFLKDRLYGLFIKDGDDPLLTEFVLWCFPIALLLGLNNILNYYISNFGRIVVSEVLQKIWNRAALPLLIIAASISYITIIQYIYGILVMMLISTAVLILYISKLKGLDLSFPYFIRDKELRNEVLGYGFFAILNAVSTQLALRIDAIMIGKMIDLTNSGAYTILLFLMGIMLIPGDSIFRISGPIISKAIAKNNLQEVALIYKNSSLILLTVGFIFFGLITININDFISILPKGEEYQGFFAVVLFLGLAKLFDMTTSLSTHIIIYSSYYRFNLYTMLILATLNILLNYFLIGLMGISGAALATFISMTIYNLIKLIYIKHRFGMQPFSKNTLKITAIGLAAVLAVFFLPKTGIPLIDIVIRTALFTPLFAVPIWLLKWVPELNTLTSQVWIRVRKLLT